MKYNRLGRTGLKVSEISLGTVELGMEYGMAAEGETLKPSEEQSYRLLNVALDRGINFIDTARVYGSSEQIIGRSLKNRRGEYTLATKIAYFQDTELHGSALQRWMRSSLEESLRALQTDVIDVLQLHSATAEIVRRREALEILVSMRDQDYVRYLGVTTDDEQAALAALEDGGYDCIQIAYNMLNRRPEERLLPLARDKDIGVVVRSVLLKGALTHRHRCLPDSLRELKDCAEQFEELAQPEPGGLPECAYRYVLAHPAVSTALVGTGRIAEVEAAVDFSARGILPATLQQAIRSISIADEAQLYPANWPIP